MVARCLFKSLTTHTKATSPSPMYSRASTILPCPSFFPLTHGTDFSLTCGSCVLLFCLGASSAPSTMAPPDSLLPNTHGSSSSSRFCFDADFVIAHSFSNSGRKHMCFLLTHSVHTTPGGMQVNTVPSAASCFHFLSAPLPPSKQSCRTHTPCTTHCLSSQPTPSPSSSSFQAMLSHHRCPWHCQGHSPRLPWDGHSSCFLPAPDAWLPPTPPTPLALSMLSVLPPELDALPLPMPPASSAPPLRAPSVPPPPATSGPMPIAAPPT